MTLSFCPLPLRFALLATLVLTGCPSDDPMDDDDAVDDDRDGFTADIGTWTGREIEPWGCVPEADVHFPQQWPQLERVVRIESGGGRVNGMVLTDDCTVVITGPFYQHFLGTVDLPVLTSPGTDGYIAAFDANADLLWARQFLRNGSESYSGTWLYTIADLGDVIVVGGTAPDGCVFDPQGENIDLGTEAVGLAMALDTETGAALWWVTFDRTAVALTPVYVTDVTRIGDHVLLDLGHEDSLGMAHGSAGWDVPIIGDKLLLDADGGLVDTGAIATAGTLKVLGRDDGGLYAFGTFDETVTLGDTTYTSENEGKDLVVGRISADGSVLWSFTLQDLPPLSYNDQSISGADVAPNGDLVLTGDFYGALSRDGEPVLNGLPETNPAYVLRISPDGDVVDAWAMQSETWVRTYEVVAFNDSVLVTGRTFFPAVLAPSHMNSLSFDVTEGHKDNSFVVRLDEDGATWMQTVEGADYNSVQAAATRNGRLFTAGYASGTTVFNRDRPETVEFGGGHEIYLTVSEALGGS
ncbi:MAG TPA: hypothetical protein EYQ31_17165 [Candidatus Handelsmanbacteria bacterium]|nr:hypothetical protein [Candidatus Handelsmanbacteria bacterium]